MTNVVSLLRESVDKDFSDHLPGLKIRIKRLTSIDFDIATSRAFRRQKSLNAASDIVEEYGLQNLEGFSTLGRLNLADPEVMGGVMSLVTTVEIAMMAIESWVGLVLENELPARIDRPTLFKLFADDHLKRAFLTEVDKAAQIVRIEKKDLPASLSGTATGAETGSAPNTAPDVPLPISLAQEASAVPVDGSVPRPS